MWLPAWIIDKLKKYKKRDKLEEEDKRPRVYIDESNGKDHDVEIDPNERSSTIH